MCSSCCCVSMCSMCCCLCCVCMYCRACMCCCVTTSCCVTMGCCVRAVASVCAVCVSRCSAGCCVSVCCLRQYMQYRLLRQCVLFAPLYAVQAVASVCVAATLISTPKRSGGGGRCIMSQPQAVQIMCVIIFQTCSTSSTYLRTQGAIELGEL